MVFEESGIHGKQFRLFRIGEPKLAKTLELCQMKIFMYAFFP